MRSSLFRKPACACAMLLAGVILGLFLWRDLHRLQRLGQRLETERAQLSALQRAAAVARRNAKKILAGNEIDAGAAGSKPAIVLLQAIEAAWSEEIGLMRLTADLPKNRLRLQVMAVSNEALFAFAGRLKRGLGEQVFIERQADLPADARSGDGMWRRDASLVVSW